MSHCTNYIKGTLPCLFLIVCSVCFAEEPPSTNQAFVPTEIFWCDANNPKPIESEDKRSLFRRWSDKLVSMHDKTSYQYMSMVHSLDDYFSGKKIEETSNGSYVKLDLKDTFYEAGQRDEGISINAKIELPNTEKRFKLIFNTDPDENKTLAEKIEDYANGQHVQKNSTIAGVEYTPDTTESKWEQSFATGIKLRVHPIPFARYQLSNKWQLNDVWSSDFKQSLWNYSDEGIGATTTFDFGRPITEKDYFNAGTTAEFRDRDNKYYYAETLSDTHRLSESSAIRYWTGVLGESHPTSEVTNYLIGVDYRRSVYKDWILLSIKPLLDFPRERNWDATPSLTFDLQIYFTE